MCMYVVSCIRNVISHAQLPWNTGLVMLFVTGTLANTTTLMPSAPWREAIMSMHIPNYVCGRPR